MKRFILIIQFLTRIPIPLQLDVTEEDFSKGIIYFPIVGLILGGISLFVYWLSGMVQNGVFPVVCAVLMNILLTGAFHLDGLADTCDGIFSARPKEQMLEIMRDSRVGTNGAIAIVFDVVFRIVLLSGMTTENVLWGIVLAPVVSRTVQSILMYRGKYARPGGGLGNFYIGKITTGRFITTLIIGSMILFGGLQIQGILMVGVCMLTIFLFRKWMEKTIDGMTGDILGAGIEIAEIMFLITLAI